MFHLLFVGGRYKVERADQYGRKVKTTSPRPSKIMDEGSWFWSGGNYSPLTSAPDEKNLPSPVRTVNTVSGLSFSSRRAMTTSMSRFPPKALRDLGRLNCSQKSEKKPHVLSSKTCLDDPNLAFDFVDDVRVLVFTRSRHIGTWDLDERLDNGVSICPVRGKPLSLQCRFLEKEVRQNIVRRR